MNEPVKPQNSSTYFIVGASGYIGAALFASANKAGSTIGTSSLGGNGLLPLPYVLGKFPPGIKNK